MTFTTGKQQRHMIKIYTCSFSQNDNIDMVVWALDWSKKCKVSNANELSQSKSLGEPRQEKCGFRKGPAQKRAARAQKMARCWKFRI